MAASLTATHKPTLGGRGGSVRSGRGRLWAALAGTLVVVVALVVALVTGLLWWRPFQPVGIDAAVRTLPADTLRVGYVAWGQVRAELDAEAVPAPEDFDELLARAYERDLLIGSALEDSLPELDEHFGVTPLAADWEAYGQARASSVSVLSFPGDVDLADVESRLGGLGYQPPAAGPGEGGTWVGTPEVVARLGLTQVQENVAVLEDDGLLVMADAPETVSRAVEVVRGDQEHLGSADGVRDLLDVAGEAATVALWTGDFACEDLAMSQAGPDDVAAARRLVEEAGGVHPLVGMVYAQDVAGGVRVGMRLASDDQASADLQPRVDLAAGEAVGQGGSFSERFRLEDAYAEGQMVVLELDPVADHLLADLGQGPVLFATC